MSAALPLAWQGNRQGTGCGRAECAHQQIHSVPAEAAVAAASAQHLFLYAPISVCCACSMFAFALHKKAMLQTWSG